MCILGTFYLLERVLETSHLQLTNGEVPSVNSLLQAQQEFPLAAPPVAMMGIQSETSRLLPAAGSRTRGKSQLHPFYNNPL